jgi:transposase
MPAEQKRPDVVEARRTWHRRVARTKPGRLIVLDETAFTTNMHTASGYAPKGERLTVYEPHGHRNTTTFVGALTPEGMIAPLVIDGPMNSLVFESYITNTLAKEIRPGDLLIMDNLSAHKTAAVRQALSRSGIKYLYLPPYSPDFSPIENAFSKVKRRMRQLAERTFSGLWSALGAVLQSISASEAENYFTACGYAVT